MAKSFEFTVTGGDKLVATLAQFQRAAPIVLARAVREQAEVFMTEVKIKHVPVMDGPLRDSGYVKPPEILPGVVRVPLGFGGPACKYAEAVHENPRSGKTDGWPPGGAGPIQFRWIGGKVRPIGARRKKWAKTGHWKYLETPLTRYAARFAVLVAARIKREWGALVWG